MGQYRVGLPNRVEKPNSIEAYSRGIVFAGN